MDDEVEMTKEELRLWIAEKVGGTGFGANDTVEKCNHLQNLIARFQSQVLLFLDLTQSVNDFESKVKSLYKSLGLVYSNVDSEDEGDNQSGPGHLLSKLSLQTSDSLLPKKKNQVEFQNVVTSIPVVVLTRLPDWKIDELVNPKPRSLAPFSSPTTTTTKNDDATTFNNASSAATINASPAATNDKDDYNSDLENVDSDDALWQPEGEEECDSDFELQPTNKRKASMVWSDDDEGLSEDEWKKRSKKKSTKKKIYFIPSKQPRQPAQPQQQPQQTPPPPAAAALPQSTTNKTTKEDNSMPVYMVTTLCQSTDANSKVPRAAPHKDITVDMVILAQKSTMSWEKAEVQGIVEREQGAKKYKVLFGDKKKTLISPHHIALDIVPEPEHVYVGARVVVGGLRGAVYRPGIVAEIPSRKNHLRFLVFIDNRTTVYVSLTFIRLVYKPLEDPLDDIRNLGHKDFVKEYIQFWPCPPQIQYTIGQPLKVERDGEMQKCEVMRTDCSMVQVKYEDDGETEWLYRGSLRLDHMANLKKRWIEKSWSHKKNPTSS